MPKIKEKNVRAKVGTYRVVCDSVYQFKRLNPIPVNKELNQFYESQYYHLIRKGGRAPELRRLMAGGKEAKRERQWLAHTLYADIFEIFKRFLKGKKVLDVGCGTGDFIAYLSQKGLEATGIEPSKDAAQIARSKKLNAYNMTLDDFIKDKGSSSKAKFDGVTLLSVLEHVPDPVSVIKQAKQILKPGGILCVRVPNDFSELQSAAQKKLKCDPWWVAVPDHINYFNFDSLQKLLKRLGFEIEYCQGDFPMELFLLMGDDYTRSPEKGSECHKKRVDLELAIPGNLRRQIYESLGRAGVGRDCMVFGRLKK